MGNDGPQSKETPHSRELREIEAAIAAEEQEWAKAQMNTIDVKYHMMVQVSRIDALVSILEGHGIDPEKLDLEYKKALLDRLQSARTEYQPEVEKARRQMIVPPLLGPNGERLV